MEKPSDLIRGLNDIVTEISSISDYKLPFKKQFSTLSRRLKLLVPLFEEIGESKEAITETSREILTSLSAALGSSRELLKLGSEGSKIYLILERDKLMGRFHEVADQIEKYVGAISFDELGISDEVREQVELVLSQFRRARGKVEGVDDVIYGELVSLYNDGEDSDGEALRKMAEKMQLMRVEDVMHESVALHELVTTSGKDPGRSIEKMGVLLRKMKDLVERENPQSVDERESGCGQSSPFIPDDFRCPISLELMADPVIVSTGQTYERACIEKWLEEGYSTCPKTQQRLTSLALTPNYVLRNLIAQWCEVNGIEPPKRQAAAAFRGRISTCSPAEQRHIEELIVKLSSSNPDDLRLAAGEIRLLAKRSADNRIAIAEAGAIPLLVAILLTSDSRTQEHAVTALLNLSICDRNKGPIVASGSVTGIVHVLKKGSMEARENAAAALFSLSMTDEHKVTIGVSGAIPPLVMLLSEGTQRGKKDAATALFNLCIFHGNRGRAVRAGAVSALMELLTEPGGSMADEALAILGILSGNSEARAAMGAAAAVPVLVDVIRNGTPRNRENAASVLVHLATSDEQCLVQACELGIATPLVELVQSGNERGKRKAAQLLDRITRIHDLQNIRGPLDPTGRAPLDPAHTTTPVDPAEP